jgi:hypothetical protein
MVLARKGKEQKPWVLLSAKSTFPKIEKVRA